MGSFVQFYPMLNVAAVPILTITLRNNLMQVLPIKRWLRGCECGAARFLLEVSYYFCLTNSGPQKTCKGSLVSYCQHSSNHHSLPNIKPTGHRNIHRRHLWNFHSIHHPRLTSPIREEKVANARNSISRIRKSKCKLVPRLGLVNFHLLLRDLHPFQRSLGPLQRKRRLVRRFIFT